MAQLKSKVDITSAGFPLLSDWATRTVMQPGNDIGRPPEVATPQILYAENVFPTKQGYKSVSYKALLAAAVPANLNFSEVITVADTAQNKALIGITTDSKIYMITAANYVWADITPVGWTGGDAISSATANGTYYLFLSRYGCYSVNITGVALTPVTLLGITPANIVGIFNSMNYLMLWDNTTVYRSSTVNPLDFVPSLITGAGSEVPYDLEGRIVTCVQLNNGFAVYTNTNIILASFSNNTQFPWIYRNANNGAGISNGKQVTSGKDLGFHIAITYAGVLQVTAQGCDVIVPEVTDFFAANVYESWDTVTNQVISQVLSAQLLYQVSIISGRYVCISYGISTYTDALIYDLAQKRWGKLKVNHVELFEIEIAVVPVTSYPYNQASEIGQSYASASPSTYNSTSRNFNSAPNIGDVFGVLAADGSISLAYADYLVDTDTGVLVLGKYQAIRDRLLQLTDIEVESIPLSNTSLKVYDIVSLDGKVNQPAMLVPPAISAQGIRTYKLRKIGVNHTLAFTGSFNLTTVQIAVELDSHR